MARAGSIPRLEDAGTDPLRPLVQVGSGEPGSGVQALAWAVEALDLRDLARAPVALEIRVARTFVLTEDAAREVAGSRADSAGRVTRSLHAALALLPAALRISGAGGGAAVYLGPARDDAEREVRARSLGPAVAAAMEQGATETGTAGGIVLIQELPGLAFASRYYPTLSGCLLTENHYPISYMKPADGIAYVVLGIDEEPDRQRFALRFAPRHPELMPDFSTPRDIFRNAQRTFRALDLAAVASRDPAAVAPGDLTIAASDPSAGPASLTTFDLDTAFADGTLAAIGGVVSLENQTVYPGVHRPGVRVVTCHQLLKGHPVPFPAVLRAIGDKLAGSSPEPARVRFSFTLPVPASGRAELVIDAIGPLPDASPAEVIEAGFERGLEHGPDDLICSSVSALGHGRIPGIRDLVYVSPSRFDATRTLEAAREVAEVNHGLAAEGRRFVLIGPGRWGSTDVSLGIPVGWDDISGAAVHVEAGLEGFNVDASRGTHFFRELTMNRIAYLHVSLTRPGDAIGWSLLDSLPAAHEGTFVRHVRFDAPLRIVVDGRRGIGVIRLPGRRER